MTVVKRLLNIPFLALNRVKKGVQWTCIIVNYICVREVIRAISQYTIKSQIKALMKAKFYWQSEMLV